MVEQVAVNFILDCLGDEVVQLALIHGKLTDERGWDVDAWRASLKEDGFLLSQASIDNSHSELTVKVWKGANASNEKVYLFLFSVISEEALDSDDFNFVDIFLSYLL